MTAKELQKRGARAENLRVLQSNDGAYFCESEEGKILYNVVVNDEGISCSCGDWARGVKKDAGFRCKHILSVLNCIPNGEVEGAHYLDRKKPQLDPRFIISIEGHEFVKYQGLLDYGPPARVLPRSRLNRFSCRPPTMGTLPYARRTWFPNRGRASQTSAMPILKTAIPRWPSICSALPAPERLLGH